jgi:hypothetical protein
MNQASSSQLVASAILQTGARARLSESCRDCRNLTGKEASAASAAAGDRAYRSAGGMLHCACEGAPYVGALCE